MLQLTDDIVRVMRKEPDFLSNNLRYRRSIVPRRRVSRKMVSLSSIGRWTEGTTRISGM